MTRCLGIDLGTTNSAVALVDENGRPSVLSNRMGAQTTPSTVSFVDEAKVLVGAPAVRRAISNPLETLYGVKRFIGRRYDEPEVQRYADSLPYRVVAAPNGDAWIQAMGKHRSPPEISAMVIRELHEVARSHLGDERIEVIITVPAHFDNAQRKATMDAALISGLSVRRLVNEPTAAALGYGAHLGEDQRIAVCDLGGGTFDVSIVNVENGIIEVISSQGDLFLGGEDVDSAMVSVLAREIREQYKVDVFEDAAALQRLRAEALSAKHTLSEATRTTLRLPYLASLPDGGKLNYEREIRREELEEWLQPFLARLALPCRTALSSCGLSASSVDSVILVGGMTRMPAIQKHLASIFGKAPKKVVNPDEIVAIGAATQAAILAGQQRGVVLLDVTSRALGMRSEGGYQRVIPQNATVPTREHRILRTLSDGQRSIRFEVYEGESSRAEENRLLGRFLCDDLPEAPAGEVMILVEFTVDVDGVLRVATNDLESGEERELRLLATAGLSRKEIDLLQQRVARG